MKILSKYKDYYDYLSGIYGEDPKIVLDRRDSAIGHQTDNSKITLYIAGYIIEGLYKNNKCYFGKALKPFIIEDSISLFKRKWLSKYEKRDYAKSVQIKSNDITFWSYMEPMKDILQINNKENCPILFIDSFNKICKYPKLDEFKLAKFIDAKTIYLWLSEWISNQITLKEQITTIMSDTLKLTSKGFDKKRSFRPKMK